MSRSFSFKEDARSKPFSVCFTVTYKLISAIYKKEWLDSTYLPHLKYSWYLSFLDNFHLNIDSFFSFQFSPTARPNSFGSLSKPTLGPHLQGTDGNYQRYLWQSPVGKNCAPYVRESLPGPFELLSQWGPEYPRGEKLHCSSSVRPPRFQGTQLLPLVRALANWKLGFPIQGRTAPRTSLDQSMAMCSDHCCICFA